MKESRGDTLSRIGQALRSSIAVPTDTMITDDIPLMLTKLSRVAAVPVEDRRSVQQLGRRRPAD